MNTPNQPHQASSAALMSESDFNDRVDAFLIHVEAALDAADTDIDSELNGGILTLTFANDSKVIVNRQAPLREIWLAAKSGGYHFRFDGATWKDTRSSENLNLALARVLREQAGVDHANVTSITF